MNPRDRERFLRDHGFSPGRYAKHGQFWTNGDKSVLVGGFQSDHRAVKNFTAEVIRIAKELGTLPEESRPVIRTVEEPMKAKFAEFVKEPVQLKIAESPRPAVVPNPPKQKIKRRYVPEVTRTALGQRCIELYAEHKSLREMTNELNAAGFRYNGGDPLEEDYVQYIIEKDVRAGKPYIPISQRPRNYDEVVPAPAQLRRGGPSARAEPSSGSRPAGPALLADAGHLHRDPHGPAPDVGAEGPDADGVREPMSQDWAIKAATEALIGMQNDCTAIMKLSKEERDSLLFSVAATLRDSVAEAPRG
jgi:hypothetical protein